MRVDLQTWNRRMADAFDRLAPERARWLGRNRGYRDEIAREYRYLVPPGQRVLEVGCGLGDLLAAVEPERGVGIDVSPEMIVRARARHPDPRLEFLAGPIEEVEPPDPVFDAVILSDVVGYLYDIQQVLERLARWCHPRTRLVLNAHSRLWEPGFRLAETLGLRARMPEASWVAREDLAGLLHLSGFEVVWTRPRVLVPARLLGLGRLLNRWLAPFPPFTLLAVTNVVVARPQRPPFPQGHRPVVSVVVPCRNEEGNIPEIVARVPRLGAATEIVLVEGGSSDGTWDACLEAQRAHLDLEIQAHRQTGTGKGDAVRLGFAEATGEVLAILDADLSVAPEDLPPFIEALLSGKAELVNGSRLVYPMETRAMRWLNLVGNKLFSLIFTGLVGQRMKDTLCGTKVLLAEDWQRILRVRDELGGIDPFGDFDLLLGAARLGLRIVDLPVRYRERTYGSTNIRRFRHGALLLRMCAVALARLKCR